MFLVLAEQLLRHFTCALLLFKNISGRRAVV